MSLPRAVIVENATVKDNIELGDILIFKSEQSIVKVMQSYISSSIMEDKYKSSTHVAIVVGKTTDGIPIISHMVPDGHRTERLDCSNYKNTEFSIHSAKNGIVRMQISHEADLDPDLTKILSRTQSKIVRENPEYLQQKLCEMKLVSDEIITDETTVFTQNAGKTAYNKTQGVVAAVKTFFNLDRTDSSAVSSPKRSRSLPKDLPAFNIGNASSNKDDQAALNEKLLQSSDSEMCVTLTVRALKEVERKLGDDHAKLNAEIEMTSIQASRGGWSKKIREWYLRTRADQLEDFDIDATHAAILPGELCELLTNANTMFTTKSTSELVPADPKSVKAVSFENENWIWQSNKIGGANEAKDEYTGVYVLKDRAGQTVARALIKQDWQGNTVRVAKIMGEGMAGCMLNYIYTQVMGVPNNRFAHVKLGRCGGEGLDETGVDTYLMSLYIPGYQHDLWKYALCDDIKASLIEKSHNHGYLITEDPITNGIIDIDDLIHHLQKKAENLMDDISRITGKSAEDSAKRHELMKQMEHIIDKINIIDVDIYQLPVNKKNAALMESVIADMAEILVSNIPRQSNAFFVPGNTKSRASISDFIIRNNLVEEFANLAAPRILLGDFGLHSANFGVVHNEQGKPHLAALDYGAAFLNMIADLNPFDNNKTGISGLDQLYKNHFLEYSSDIIKSTAMAEAFIKLGNMSNDQLNQFLAYGFAEVLDKYGHEALDEFYKRIGYKDQNDDAFDFLAERLQARIASLQDIGFQIILERCFDHDNQRMKDKILDSFLNYPGLEDYFKERMNDSNLYVINKKEYKELVMAGRELLEEVDNHNLIEDIVNENAILLQSINELELSFDQNLADITLIEAARSDNITITTWLIEHGANIYAMTSNGTCLLDDLDKTEHPDSYHLLLKKHEDITRFMKAAADGEIETVEEMLNDGFNINTRDKLGNTALFKTYETDQLGCAEYLLSHGIDTGIVNHNNETADALLQSIPINIEMPDLPLMYAVQEGDLEWIKQLISEDLVEINEQDPDTGNTPIILAGLNGRWDIVSELLKAPAIDIKLENVNGESILQLAAEANEESVVKAITASPQMRKVPARVGDSEKHAIVYEKTKTGFSQSFGSFAPDKPAIKSAGETPGETDRSTFKK